MNKIILMGRCTDKPIIQTTKAGGYIAKFSVADNSKENGAESTNYFSVKCLRTATATYVEKYLIKGSRVLIDGVIKIEKFVGNDGQNKTAYSVLADNVNILDFKKDDVEEVKKDDEVEDNSDFDISSINLSDEDLPF